MSKYTITHACGHEETVQLYGPMCERDRKAEWMATLDCPECRRAAKVEAAKAKGMTEGTDKQIAWASDILTDALRLVDMRAVATKMAALCDNAQELNAKLAVIGKDEALKRIDAAIAKSSASAWRCKAVAIISHSATLHDEIATAAAKNVLKSL